jgi:voltage-gated potassium channel
MGWLVERRFLALLIALACLFVVYPFTRGLTVSRFLFVSFMVLLFLAAFLVLFQEKWSRWPALVLGVVFLVCSVASYSFPERLPLLFDQSWHVLGACFGSFTLVVVLRMIAAERQVSADAVYGAFCGYLLIALIFAHLYCLQETHQPGSFVGEPGLSARLASATDQLFLLFYFSLVTLTTLGYGDIHPASDPARGLACVEAVIGQFYVGVLVADLVGKRVAQAFTPPANPPAPPQ